MLLFIISLGIIAKIVSVCDGCNIGLSKVNSFDWKQVDITLNTQLLNHQLSVLVLQFIFHLWFH